MTRLEFHRLDEHPPEEGVRIDMCVPNPSYDTEIEEYRAALERNPFAENDVTETFVAHLVDPPDTLLAPDEVCVPHE